MNRPIIIKPLPNWKLEIVFKNGFKGIYDMSASIGKGVFSPLKDPATFNQVHIGKYGQITWSEEMEICSDSVYKALTLEALTHA
jgi:hypothetical protein